MRPVMGFMGASPIASRICSIFMPVSSFASSSGFDVFISIVFDREFLHVDDVRMDSVVDRSAGGAGVAGVVRELETIEGLGQFQGGFPLAGALAPANRSVGGTRFRRRAERRIALIPAFPGILAKAMSFLIRPASAPLRRGSAAIRPDKYPDQGTSLRLATHPWPETTGEYCRNSPGLCSPHSRSEEGGQARDLGRCQRNQLSCTFPKRPMGARAAFRKKAVGNPRRRLLRRAGRDDAAPVFPAFGAQVNNIVARPDHFKVVLDDDDGVAEADELREDLEELPDVVEMKAGRRLVQEIERPAGGPLAQFLGQLDPLGFAARERSGGLAEPEVAEPDLPQGRQLAFESGLGLEIFVRFVHGHRQKVGDRLALVADRQRFLVVAQSPASVAGDKDVREEMHFDPLHPGALAVLAPASGNVEAEPARAVAAGPGPPGPRAKS